MGHIPYMNPSVPASREAIDVLAQEAPIPNVFPRGPDGLFELPSGRLGPSEGDEAKAHSNTQARKGTGGTHECIGLCVPTQDAVLFR